MIYPIIDQQVFASLPFFFFLSLLASGTFSPRRQQLLPPPAAFSLIPPQQSVFFPGRIETGDKFYEFYFIF